MLRRYWSKLAAFGRLIAGNFRANTRNPWVVGRSILISLGLVLVVQTCYYLNDAAEQRNSEYSYQPAAHASFTNFVKGQTPPAPYEPNCKNPQKYENADLCAQWASVAQVMETNRLASLSLKMSLGTLLATFFGTGLLVWTLRETRQIAQRELRAYVSVEMAGLQFDLFKSKAFAHIVLKNGGQTPAYLCCHNGNVFVATDEDAERDIMHRLHAHQGRAKPFTLHMNDPQGGSIFAYDPITYSDLKEVVEGEKWLYVFGTVFYRDTFGIDRKTRICIKTDDFDLPDSDDPAEWTRYRPPPKQIEWTMAHFHNDST